MSCIAAAASVPVSNWTSLQSACGNPSTLCLWAVQSCSCRLVWADSSAAASVYLTFNPKVFRSLAQWQPHSSTTMSSWCLMTIFPFSKYSMDSGARRVGTQDTHGTLSGWWSFRRLWREKRRMIRSQCLINRYVMLQQILCSESIGHCLKLRLTCMYAWLVGVKVSSTGVGQLPSQR